MKKMFLFIFAIIPLVSFSVVTLDLSMFSTEEASSVLADVQEKILELLPKEATITNSSTATFSMTFFLSYDATDNLYVGEWKHGNEVARYEYNPRGYKYYRDFVMECASFPLEKVSVYLFSKMSFQMCSGSPIIPHSMSTVTFQADTWFSLLKDSPATEICS